MANVNEVMNEVMADNVVENIAQMNLEQRNLFVNTFVKKWPVFGEGNRFVKNISLRQCAPGLAGAPPGL